MPRERNLWCKHYRAMYEHQTCKAGVEYADLKQMPHDFHPCFNRSVGVCNLAEYPTPEEMAAKEQEFKQHFEISMKARAAIVEHLGGSWTKGAPGASGEIPCPICGGTLRFSRAGYNGHIHARCTTENCVAWME